MAYNTRVKVMHYIAFTGYSNDEKIQFKNKLQGIAVEFTSTVRL